MPALCRVVPNRFALLVSSFLLLERKRERKSLRNYRVYHRQSLGLPWIESLRRGVVIAPSLCHRITFPAKTKSTARDRLSSLNEETSRRTRNTGRVPMSRTILKRSKRSKKTHRARVNSQRRRWFLRGRGRSETATRSLVTRFYLPSSLAFGEVN